MEARSPSSCFSQAPDCGVKSSLSPLRPVSTSGLSRCPRGTAIIPLPISCCTLLPEIYSLSSCFHPVFLQPCFQHNAHCLVIPDSTLSHQIQTAPPGIQALAAISALPYSISSLVTTAPQLSFPYLTWLTPHTFQPLPQGLLFQKLFLGSSS